MENDTTKTVEGEVAPVTDEERRQAEQEADDALSRGFNKANKKDTETKLADETAPSGNTQTAETTADATTAATPEQTGAAEKSEPAKDPWEGVPPIVKEQLEKLVSVPDAIRRLDGSIGGLKGQFQNALATAKAAAEKRGEEAPSDKQIEQALSDPKAMERLMEEFPDFAGPVANELKAIRAELAKKSAPDVEAIKATLKQELDAEVAKARQEIAIDAVEAVHEGWQKTVATKDFDAWLKGQPEDTRKLAVSERPRDAIRLLYSYKKHREEAAKAAEEAQKRQQRLHGATVPQGTSSPSAPGVLPDEAGLEVGFKKVNRLRATT